MTSLSKILTEFGQLIDQIRSLKPKGWNFKIRNYQKVIDCLKTLDFNKSYTTGELLPILREGGMKLKDESPEGPYTSQILIKIDKILKDGSLGLEMDEKTLCLKELLRIPEIGPAKAEQLYQEGIRSIDDLRKSSHLNRKQEIGLRHYKDLEKKIPRTEMDQWMDILDGIVVNKESLELAGSYRRGNEESGDIDCYISVKQMDKGLMKTISKKLIELGYLDERDIISCGTKKMMCVVKGEVARHLDVFIYPSDEYAFALLFATGSGNFNIRMRNHALEKGYSLSDMGLRIGNNKGEWISQEQIEKKLGKDKISKEKDIFDFLDLKYIEPNKRACVQKLESN
jgi:DNA polymerase/3'-5' exonuclease PolX